MIDVHYHYGLESPLVGEALRWSSILAISGAEKTYRARYNTLDERNILHFFAFDPDYANSISSCVGLARENARSIRDTISSEMWQCVNKWYLGMRTWNVDSVLKVSPHAFFTWVKNESHLFQGITNRTLMMGEARDFHDAGRFLERADQTARILDVKYHVLLPDESNVGGGLDYFQWASILRAVSALTAYRWVYHDSLKPWLIADLLVLNEQMPRSIASCYANLAGYLDELSQAYGRQGPAQRTARSIRTRLQNTTVAEIFQRTGLHEFLTDFIADNARLGDAIADQYLA